MPVRHLAHCALLLCVMGCTSSDDKGVGGPADAPSAIFLTLEFDAVEDVEGWLYSYGLSWVACPEPDGGLARWLGVLGTAHASHPIVYEGDGEWSWHTPIPLGPPSEHVLERRIEPGRYCGLVWVFSHGGVPYQGELAALSLTGEAGVIAASHHAGSVPIAFPEPICVSDGPRAVRIRFRTPDWVAQIELASNRGTATRDGWRYFRDFVEVTAPPCP